MKVSIRFALLTSVILSIILVIIKLYGFITTNSIAILATFFDSLFDIFISLFNNFVFFYASKPADDKHRFGHNSIEDIAGLLQGAFFASSGLFIIYKSIIHIYDDNVILEKLDAGIIVIIISILINFIIISIQYYSLKKAKQSVILKTELLHYTSDIFLNLTVLISLLLSNIYIGNRYIDVIIAILVGLYIIYQSFQISKICYNNLMDKEIEDKELIDNIKKDIVIFKGVEGLHDLRTRQSGTKKFIQFHLDLSNKLTFQEAHDISEDLEEFLKNKYRIKEIIIHQDPIEV